MTAPETARRSSPLDTGGLYEIVATYAGFGDHRTGTSADEHTVGWLVERLSGMGAEVDAPSFEFERWVGGAELLADGRLVPCVPVAYSATGQHATAAVGVMTVDGSVAGPTGALDPILAESASINEATILAVGGPDELPVHCNQAPVVSMEHPAVVIAANREIEARAAADRGRLVLRFDGAVEPARGRNVVARLASESAVTAGPPVTVTTPLTGWGPCAGERGTGLAAALVMAEALADDHRVTFVGCGGHELDHIGLQHHLASHRAAETSVIHLGASVAAVEPGPDGRPALGRQRLVLTTADGDARAAIADAAAAGGWRLHDGHDWQGEGANWRRAGASVLSFVGRTPLFHTAADVPEAATTLDALVTASAAAIDTARRFLAVDG